MTVSTGRRVARDCLGCGRRTRAVAGFCSACQAASQTALQGLRAAVRSVPSARFARMVDTAGPVPVTAPQLGPCWVWQGALSSDGYGVFRIGPGLLVYAHRYALEQALGGPLPAGYEPDHRCHDPAACRLGVDCPHRRCVNPGHLLAVPGVVNRLRSGAPPADNARKTSCLRGHPLEGENVYVHPTRGTRHCRRCQADREAAWRQTAKQRAGKARAGG